MLKREGCFFFLFSFDFFLLLLSSPIAGQLRTCAMIELLALAEV